MLRCVGVFVAGLILPLCSATVSIAVGQEPPVVVSEPVVVLDTIGFWRLHHTLQAPVIEFDDGVKPIPLEKKWLDRETPPPRADWAKVEFDDSSWLRGPARIAIRTPFLARLCMRGKFMVTDPAEVQGLALSLAYQGGVVAYLNGQEVARGHLPKGVAAEKALAEGYPTEAYLTRDGKWLRRWEAADKADAETARRLELRNRTLTDIPIPQRLLRKGLNVVGIEIIRAPYHKIVDQEKLKPRRGQPSQYDLCFNTCEFTSVRLTATGGAGVVPDAVRPEGLQVWESDVLAADFDLDFAGRAESLYPIRIVGARNGSFSGKVVVGSTKPIRGLKVEAAELKAEAGATIPASAVRIRYAIPWDWERGVYTPHYGMADIKYPRYPSQPVLLGALAEEPLKEFPVSSQRRAGRYDLSLPGQPEPVRGAVVPIWVTVKVPADARPGRYAGQVTIRAEGEQPIVVPVEVKVADWTLPDSKDYRTWVELTQSPDTLAIEYGLKPWSAEHLRMIARSMDFLNEVGSGVLYVPLIARSNLGNEESMVRWIKKGGDRYEHDFSVMERYLDVAEKHMGRPKIVCFVVWDIYLCPKKQIKGTFTNTREFPEVVKARESLKGTGPGVTVLDPATGTTELVYLKPFTDPSAKALWKPLFDELRKRMKRRGLQDTMMLGLVSDAWPVKAEDELFKELSGGVPWVSHSHLGVRHGKTYSSTHFTNCPINTAYETRIINTAFAYDDPENGSLGGWSQPQLVAQHERHAATFPASRWRHIVEINITGRQRGIGRLGGDFWPVGRNKYGGRLGTVDQRYPESFWRNLNMTSSLLAPGPSGPVATYRFEAMREGVQECEARIVLERALTDQKLKSKLGPDLARRCRECLVERTAFMLKSASNLQMSDRSYAMADRFIRRAGIAGHYWFVGSAWQGRTEKLYALAGQVEKKLGKK